MKMSYSKPELTELGHVADLTESNNAAFETDVPYGTVGSPSLPGGGIIGSV